MTSALWTAQPCGKGFRKSVRMVYTTYIFDFGSAVADLTRGYRIAYSETFRHFGMPFDPSLENEYYSTPPDILFGRYHRGCTCMYRDFITMLMSIYDRNVISGTSIRKDAAGCIAVLGNAGCRLGIVSDSYEQHIRQILKEYGLEKAFGSIVGAERMALKRPHPYCIDLCLNEMGAGRTETLIVSSDPKDIEAGRKAGVDTALVDRDGTIGPDCAPTHYLNRLEAALLL